jgi:glutaminase
VGDVGQRFTIQSISKPFVYGFVLEALGLEETLSKVGVEPSGEAFNSISLYPDTGRPYNPMINAGAIACTGLFHTLHGERTVERLVQRFSRLAGHTLEIDRPCATRSAAPATGTARLPTSSATSTSSPATTWSAPSTPTSRSAPSS